jgi:nucleotide-binding universal stress UspA family protein
MAILVPYDGSVPAQEAVEHAIEEYGDRQIVLLRVVELATGMTDAGWELLKEELKERRKEIAADVTDELEALIDERDVEFEIETVTGNPAREIVRYAEDEDNDIEYIVIGSHGREGISRVLLGSVAERVVRRSPGPVVVVR